MAVLPELGGSTGKAAQKAWPSDDMSTCCVVAGGVSTDGS